MAMPVSHQDLIGGARFAYGPHATFFAALAVGIAALAAARAWMPPEATLPFLCLICAVMAALVAVAGFRPPRPARRGLTYEDVAGMLTFVAIVLAALVEPDEMVQLVRAANRE